MDDIDRTFEILKRPLFDDVLNKIFEADPYGSMTVNKMNGDKRWKVSSSFEYIIVENHWTVKEFNEELHIRYEKYNRSDETPG